MEALLKYFTPEELEQLQTLDLYSRNKALVSKLFFHKKDKSGKPYIGHLLRVSENMTSIDGKIAGLLHDVVEDIQGVTFNDLISFGVPKHIIEALKLVTKEETKELLTKEQKLQKYNQEIDRIIESRNLLALDLKIADMSDNYDPNRLEELDEEKRKWFEQKYGQNIKRLRKVREEYDRH